jgi:hypothetical protein
MGVDEHWRPGGALSASKVEFKVGMVMIDDPFFLRDLVEGTDYWWVDLNKMSEAYLPHLGRIKEAKRAAEKEAAEGVAVETFAAAAKKTKTNASWQTAPRDGALQPPSGGRPLAQPASLPQVQLCGGQGALPGAYPARRHGAAVQDCRQRHVRGHTRQRTGDSGAGVGGSSGGIGPSSACKLGRRRSQAPAARPAAAAQAAALSEPQEREIESFGELLLGDLVCALSRDHSVFCPLTFWAAPSFIAKFPTLAALARGEFSGLGAEATSERTFSYSGRVYSKLRRSMSMENLASMVIGAAYPGVLTNNQIMDKYLSNAAISISAPS